MSESFINALEPRGFCSVWWPSPECLNKLLDGDFLRHLNFVKIVIGLRLLSWHQHECFRNTAHIVKREATETWLFDDLISSALRRRSQQFKPLPLKLCVRRVCAAD